ncbi:SHOCT domain-containing protein [Actinopolymorpha rutila]
MTIGAEDELGKLAQLRDHGDISEAEYQKAKEKIIG